MKLLLCVVAAVFFTGCVKPCQDLWGLENSTLVIYLFDRAADQYLYIDNDNLSLFKKDSFKVFNEDGRKFELVSFARESDPRDRVKGFFAVAIAPAFMIPDDNDAFTREKTRNIHP